MDFNWDDWLPLKGAVEAAGSSQRLFAGVSSGSVKAMAYHNGLPLKIPTRVWSPDARKIAEQSGRITWQGSRHSFRLSGWSPLGGEVWVHRPSLLAWLSPDISPSASANSSLATSKAQSCSAPRNERETASAPPSDRAAQDWYRRRVADWPASRPPPSRVLDEEDAKLALPGLTRDRLRRLRHDLAPDSWKQPGKRKSGEKI